MAYSPARQHSIEIARIHGRENPLLPPAPVTGDELSPVARTMAFHAPSQAPFLGMAHPGRAPRPVGQDAAPRGG
jgi:hypothetical protein